MSTRTFLIQGIQVAKGKYTVQDLKKKKTPQRTQHGKLKRQHELVKHTHTHTQKKKKNNIATCVYAKTTWFPRGSRIVKKKKKKKRHY